MEGGAGAGRRGKGRDDTCRAEAIRLVAVEGRDVLAGITVVLFPERPVDPGPKGYHTGFPGLMFRATPDRMRRR
jgi:hypothetical protein